MYCTLLSYQSLLGSCSHDPSQTNYDRPSKRKVGEELGSPLSATCGLQTSSRRLQCTTALQSESATREMGQTQRTKKETMSEERRKRLDSIGFTWKVREAHIPVDWEIRFQQLVDYKRVHGNCNVPIKYNANPQLGNWVRQQRTKKETMSEEKRKRLNSIGFTWKVREAHIPVDWEIRFQQLVDYKRVSRQLQRTTRVQRESTTREWVRHNEQIRRQ